MKIIRIYNNNVIVSHDGNSEVIVIGRGIGFQKRAGDIVDMSKAEKLFALKDRAVMSKLQMILKDIPGIYLEIVEAIIGMIRESSDLILNESIYITLVDHISVAIEREKKGVIHPNQLLVDIRQIYRKEFQLALSAGKIIKEYTGVDISQDEVGFIALHIANASMNQDFTVTLKATQLIPEIVKIVEAHYGVKLETTSLKYCRFIRHLQFFVRRVLSPESGQDRQENDILGQAIKTFKTATACMDLIDQYIYKEIEQHATPAEKAYITYHIVTLTSECGQVK